MQDAFLLFRAVVGGGGVKLIALAGRVGLQLIAQIAVERALDIWKDSDNLRTASAADFTHLFLIFSEYPLSSIIASILSTSSGLT